MTSRERVVAAFTGVIPDRVPFFPTIYIDHACVACGQSFEASLVNPALGAGCMVDAALRYKADACRFVLGPPASWYDEKSVEARDGDLLQIDRKSGEIDGQFDVPGGGNLRLRHPPANVTCRADVDAFPVTSADEYEQRGCLKDVKPCIERAHAAGLFVTGMCSGQTLNFMVARMGSPEAALLAFYDDPALVIALIDKAVRISLEQAAAFIRAGVDCILIGDSYTSGSVISPELYQRFCEPAYRETCAEIHRAGVLCYKHCCGNYNPFLSRLPEVGINAMDGIDPTSGMSVAHTKAVVGDRVTLMGGISCLTLLNGSVDEVYDEAAVCVRDGKPGGRFVLGSACAVPRFTPPENMAAAQRAAAELGVYP